MVFVIGWVGVVDASKSAKISENATFATYFTSLMGFGCGCEEGGVAISEGQD